MRFARTATVMAAAVVLLSIPLGASALSFTEGPLVYPVDPLAGGSPTSARIVWATDAAASGNSVYISGSPAGPWTAAASSAASATRHDLTVNGLAPETIYYAYVVSGGLTSSVFQFHTGENLLVNGSLETWHPVTGQTWGSEEPDGWHGWEISPWTPPDSSNPANISISKDRPTGLPSPLVQHGQHRVGMDEGWRTCYGGIYQTISGLTPGAYELSAWVAWLFDISLNDQHFVEVLVKDGSHTPGSAPTGVYVFRQNGSRSRTSWQLVQDLVQCNTGTLTIYLNLRSDNFDGASFAHFDGIRLVPAELSAVTFSNWNVQRTINGSVYDITISYDTDVPCTTRLLWGPTPSLGNQAPEDATLKTHHEVTLQGVTPRPQDYNFRAAGQTEAGVTATSALQSFAAPQVVISAINSTVEPSTGTICSITWKTNYPTTYNVVAYRPGSEGAYTIIQAPSDPAPATEHSVTLSDLDLNSVYRFNITSGADDILSTTTSPDNSFITPEFPGQQGFYLGMSMIGGSLPDGGDDIGPANEVQDMIERDHPLVNISGIRGHAWADVQPNDPGAGPNVYDWSKGDANIPLAIPGKARTVYFQVWGNYPSWLTLDTPRYWEKFEQFVEAMAIHLNESYGDIDFTFENEPNISRAPDGWNWADWYMHTLRHFYTAVHRADAQTGRTNRVIAGNLAGHSANGFAELYARGLKDYSDVLGYHAYPRHIRDGVEVADLARVHEIQEQYGDPDKKIFVSEGWGSGRSAGFHRSSPTIEPSADEIDNMYVAMVKGWDNVMTPRDHWHPDYLYGMKFFCGNDNWGAGNWRRRATPKKDSSGNVTGFIVDGYHMDPDIAPQFWNGGMMDWYGTSKDALALVFPGDGLVFMNSGFELPSSPPLAHFPHFWQSSISPAPPSVYQLDSSVFHGGSHSLRISLGSSGSATATQATAKRSVTPGLEYRSRIWIRTGELDGYARFWMRFWDLEGNQKSEPVFAEPVYAHQGWTQVQVTAAAPPYARRAEVGCVITGTGTAWFDDLTIALAAREEVGNLRGFTLDENQLPVADAIVRTTTGGYQAISDEDGYYEINGVASGTYDLVCRKDGYVPHRVKNQTVAAGRLTFASYNMRLPKTGLNVVSVETGGSHAQPGATIPVTVQVQNAKPYPVILSDVGCFVEENGQEASGSFTILPAPGNPAVIPAFSQSTFNFTLEPLDASNGRKFSVNAYAFGQEDRPNLLQNGDFSFTDVFHHWGFSGGSQQALWLEDRSTFFSAPASLKHVVSDPNGGQFNWGGNYSAWGPSALPAKPAQKYIVGAYHKDSTQGVIDHLLFIEEFYYNGNDWLYNGRRFSAVPPRSVWTDDYMIYETGNPAVTPGLYSCNRLRVSVGSFPRTGGSSSTSWWDDIYLKEEGDWIAADRAAAGAGLTVASGAANLADALSQDEGAWVRVDDLVVSAGSESFAGRFYIQQPDRASGAAAVALQDPAPARSQLVTLTGRVGYLDGERALLDAEIISEESGQPARPLFVQASLLAPEIQPLLQGLLVRTWGKVVSVNAGEGFFMLDNGRGGTLKVICSDAVSAPALPQTGAFVTVTGICGAQHNGATAVLRVRDAADLSPL